MKSGILAFLILLNPDVIKLKNGNFFEGRVRNISQSRLVMETDYGEMRLPLEEVLEVETGRLFFYMKDGSSFSASITGIKFPFLFTTLKKVSLYNVEEVKVKRRKYISFGFNVGVSVAKGNSDIQSYTTSMKLTFKRKSFLISLAGENSYGVSSGSTSANYQKGELKFEWGRKWGISAFGTGTAMRDAVAELDLRATFTGGVGYHLFFDNLTLFPHLGPSFYHEDYKGTPPKRSLRIYLGFTFAYEVEYLEIEVSSSWFISTDDFYDNFSEYTLTARSRITRNFYLFLTASDSYNNRPPEGRKHNDLRITSGVEVKL